MKDSNKKTFSIILPLLLLVLIVSLFILIFIRLNYSIEKAFQPIELANEQIATQVNQMLNPTPTIILDPITARRLNATQ